MIISASRRTDIPAFYSDWFFERIREGRVLVRNPMRFHNLSEIDLSPGAVDAIVFWTKNPTPMLDRLGLLSEYRFCFQFTLNSYGDDIETNLVSKNRLVPAFRRLSELTSPERVIWRYDPIFLTPKYSVGWHLEYFGRLASLLSGYTKRCTISFLDLYKNTEKNLASARLLPMSLDDVRLIARGISEIARENGMSVFTCAEEYNLDEFGIAHGSCVGAEFIEKLTGKKLQARKDRYQRGGCLCVESVDIGAYNTCENGCKYCYANYSPWQIGRNRAAGDTKSPLITGNVTPEDIIRKRG